MRIAGYFGTLLNPQIAGIPIYHFIIFTNQCSGLCDVMLIRRGDRNGMHQSAACVHADVALHSEFPLIALFCLVHFRVTGFVRIFSGAGGIDDGCVYNGSALHHVPGLHHNTVDCVKKQLVQTMCFQKMAEIAQRCFIRHCLCHEVNACEFPHGIAVVDSILGSRIGQVEPNLKQIHPQHFFNAHGRTATLSLGIVGPDDTNPLVPGNDLVHDFQKLFPLGFLLAEAVFDVGKCFLLHCLHHHCFDGVIIPYLEPLW